jgi:hypothetical protein
MRHSCEQRAAFWPEEFCGRDWCDVLSKKREHPADMLHLKVRCDHWFIVGLEQVSVVEVSPPEVEEFLACPFGRSFEVSLCSRTQMWYASNPRSEAMPVEVVMIRVE